MLDFTNYNKRRGIVILSSQEYRKLYDAFNGIDVYKQCISDYAERLTENDMLKAKEEFKVLGQYGFIMSNIEAIVRWTKDIDKKLDIIKSVLI